MRKYIIYKDYLGERHIYDENATQLNLTGCSAASEVMPGKTEETIHDYLLSVSTFTELFYS